MTESYFLITSDEDGIRIKQLTEQELLAEIHEEIEQDYKNRMEFLDKIPDIDRGYMVGTNIESPALIIKGKIITPKPVKEITKYEID